MNDADILNAWDEGAPPARSAAFRIAVLQRLEARRFAARMSLVLTAGAGLVVLMIGLRAEIAAALAALPMGAGVYAVVGLGVAATAWGLMRAFKVRIV